MTYQRDMQNVIADLAAENDRLREALGEIAGRYWLDEGGRIAAALARDGLNGTGRFAPGPGEDRG